MVYQARGEKALLLAMIERAIFDAAGQHGGVGGPRKKQLAIQWVKYWDEEDRADPFSFVWICEQLDLCPYKVSKLVEVVASADNLRHFSNYGRFTTVRELIEFIENDSTYQYAISALS